jgi:2-haloacid dehalogenase
VKTYRGFLFDADNTLFDYDGAERAALTATILEAVPGVDLEHALAAYRTINAGYWRRFEEGAVSLGVLKPGRFRDLLDLLGAQGDPAAISARYLELLAAQSRMLPHAREVLESLAARAKLCLVTNGLSPVQRGRLARAGIGDLFTGVLISEEIGVSKPDPAFFHRAAAALALDTSQLLCIGDHPTADVRGALGAGIDACWYSPQGAPWPLGEPLPTLIIADLRELEPLAAGG